MNFVNVQDETVQQYRKHGQTNAAEMSGTFERSGARSIGLCVVNHSHDAERNGGTDNVTGRIQKEITQRQQAVDNLMKAIKYG